jgi:hypothetical protein
MITMERSLAMLVRDGKVDAREAERYADDALAFLDELQHATGEPPPAPGK